MDFPQWTYLTVHVDKIAFLHIVKNFIKIAGITFGCQFIITTLGTYFGGCCYIYFHFCIGEYSGADVTSIHDDSLFKPHLLLLFNKSTPHKGEGGNRTYM